MNDRPKPGDDDDVFPEIENQPGTVQSFSGAETPDQIDPLDTEQISDDDPSRDGQQALKQRLVNYFADSGKEALAKIDADNNLVAQANLGDFQLIRQIGHGGMGVVYEARQLSLGRRVAVKILPFAAVLNPQHRKRFQIEARAAATLAHPNIVPVYFVGQEEGVHFYVMQLIEGLSMAQMIEGLQRASGSSRLPVRSENDRPGSSIRSGPASGTAFQETKVGEEAAGPVHESSVLFPGENPPRPLPRPTLLREGDGKSPVPEPGREESRPEVDEFQSTISTQLREDPTAFFLSAARLGAEAAEALDHAHQLGILHRDIKPGNLMIDHTGNLWVTDFGLATIEHGETLTRTGGVVGTAAYMSPEQASDSHLIDRRSDVYSLGATLYELLTLRRHRAGEATRLNVISELRSTSRIAFDASIPVDLETIVVKALSFDPTDRYQSAQAFAEDLRAFISGHEIRAQRLSLVQRQARWLRRHSGLTTGLVISSFLLLLMFGSAMLINSRQLSENSRQLAAALSIATDARAEAENQSKIADDRLERAERSERAAKQSEQAARASELGAQRMAYRTDTQRAFDRFSSGNLVDSKYLLAKHIPKPGDPDLRGVEWWLLNAEASEKSFSLGSGDELLGSHDGPATECVLYPDGNTVATAGEDGVVQVWDIASRQKIRTFKPGIGQIHAIAISPDGKTLAIGGKPTIATFFRARVHLLDAHTGERKWVIQNHETTIESIRFSPNGKLIAAGSRYHEVQLSTIDGEPLHAFQGDDRNQAIAFSPDSRFLAAVKNGNEVGIWDCNTGKRTTVKIVKAHPVNFIEWSPTENYLIILQEDNPLISVHDAETGREIANPADTTTDSGEFSVVEISANGQEIVAGDVEGRIHRWPAEPSFWRAQSKRDERARWQTPSVAPVAVHQERITSIIHLADGSVVTLDGLGNVNVTGQQKSAAKVRSPGLNASAAVMRSASSLVLGTSSGAIHTYQIDTGEVGDVSAGFGSPVLDLAITDDRQSLAVIYNLGRIDLIDLESGRVFWSQTDCIELDRTNKGTGYFQISLSPNGRYIARTGLDNYVTVWDVDQTKPVLQQPFSGWGSSVAFSPDGSTFAHGSDHVYLYSSESWELIDSMRGLSPSRVTFSPDSRYLASGHDDGSVRLFNRTSGAKRILRGNLSKIFHLTFAPSNSTILAAGFGRSRDEVCIWDVPSGEAYGAIAIPSIMDTTDIKIFAIADHVFMCTLHKFNTSSSKLFDWNLAR